MNSTLPVRPRAMLDLDREEYIPLRVAAKLVPSGRNPGKPVHVSTLFRWTKKGVRGKRLTTYLIGAYRYTTKAALDRFLAELNEDSSPPVLITKRDPVRDSRTKRILNRERLSAGTARTDSAAS